MADEKAKTAVAKEAPKEAPKQDNDKEEAPKKATPLHELLKESRENFRKIRASEAKKNK